MGARLLSGGLRRDAVWGLGGATVMDSLTPKFQVTGDPGLESTLLGTSPTTSCRLSFNENMEIELDSLYLVPSWLGWGYGVYSYWSDLLDQVPVV